jgi:hypothetical protein
MEQRVEEINIKLNEIECAFSADDASVEACELPPNLELSQAGSQSKKSANPKASEKSILMTAIPEELSVVASEFKDQFITVKKKATDTALCIPSSPIFKDSPNKNLKKP